MDGDSRPVILFFHCEIASYSILLQRNALYSKIHLRQKIPVIIFVRLMLLQFELNSLSLSHLSTHVAQVTNLMKTRGQSFLYSLSLVRSFVSEQKRILFHGACTQVALFMTSCNDVAHISSLPTSFFVYLHFYSFQHRIGFFLSLSLCFHFLFQVPTYLGTSRNFIPMPTSCDLFTNQLFLCLLFLAQCHQLLCVCT